MIYLAFLRLALLATNTCKLQWYHFCGSDEGVIVVVVVVVVLVLEEIVMMMVVMVVVPVVVVLVLRRSGGACVGADVCAGADIYIWPVVLVSLEAV